MAKIKKGDTVYVISGQDRGMKGEILQVKPKENKVLVQGVNIKNKHTKPSQKNPDGGIFQREHFVHISNVALAEPGVKESLQWSSQLTTRVGYRYEEGKKVRYSKRSGQLID